LSIPPVYLETREVMVAKLPAEEWTMEHVRNWASLAHFTAILAPGEGFREVRLRAESGASRLTADVRTVHPKSSSTDTQDAHVLNVN
jgi:hypothetical protein